MIELELEQLIETEMEKFTFASEVDIECFNRHRIKPKKIKLYLDQDGNEWTECFLITEHNGENDSPYRAAYDPKHSKFVRELTMDNNIPHYLGRYQSLEDLVDDFA